MVSTLPTIALKAVRIPHRLVVPLLILLVFAVVAFLFQPRIVALIGIAVYALHIPYAVLRYRYLSRHPEQWEREPQVRRRNNRQLRLRVRPQRARVAGRLSDGTVAPPRVRSRSIRSQRLRRRDNPSDFR
jgi:CDP-diacylglycerol--serine O-phosphatidyltransferase